MSRLLLLLLLASCASVEKPPEGFFIPKADLDCDSGCVVVSTDKLREFVLRHRAEAAKEAQGACLANTWGGVEVMLLRLSHVMESAIVPALSLLPKYLDSQPARAMLLAIGLQESAFTFRTQIGGGPARGFWQFEPGTQKSRGGVYGVYLHHSTHEPLRLLCHDRDVNFDPKPIWQALEWDDVLAAGVARLLLLTDPHPLPKLGETQEAWECYLRTWRPGKPRPDAWAANYADAMQEVKQ
jgi:hypothetical protein